MESIFSHISDENTRDVTKWCLSLCNKELFLTLPVCLNACFLEDRDVWNADITESCAIMLLHMNRLSFRMLTWSEKAADCGWLSFLHEMCLKGGNFMSAARSLFVLDILLKHRRMDIIIALHGNGIDDMLLWNAFEKAVKLGYMEFIHWLHTHYPGRTYHWAMDVAARFGHLDVVVYLHTHRLTTQKSWAIDFAAMNGHYDVVVYLHTHGIGLATTKAMDKAAQYGHLSIVQYLDKNREEGCTTDAMDEAACYGHLDVVQYLDENRKEGCTTDAMDYAARNGHYDVVTFLNEKRAEGFSTVAIVAAEVNGYTDIADYLREHGKYHKHAEDDAFEETMYF